MPKSAFYPILRWKKTHQIRLFSNSLLSDTNPFDEDVLVPNNIFRRWASQSAVGEEPKGSSAHPACPGVRTAHNLFLKENNP